MVSAASAEPYRIVGFGDSLMAGYGLAPGEGFPEKLEAALRKKGHDVVIANAGVSGDTTSGGLVAKVISLLTRRGARGYRAEP